jgi:hypothetical protein
VAINEDSEAIISIPEVAEVIIEGVVVATFKILPGAPGQVDRVVDSIIVLGMLHRNRAHLNNNIRPRQDLMITPLSTLPLQRKRKTPTTFSDRPKTYKSRTRKKLRRTMTKRCHLRAGLLQQVPKASKTQNLALLSKVLPRQPRLLQSPKSLKSSTRLRLEEMLTLLQTVLEGPIPEIFPPNQRPPDGQISANLRLRQR